MGKFLKGAKVFTGTLLFGSDESQGLIKTLGSASLEAGKNFGAVMLDTKEDDQNRFVALGGEQDIPDGWGWGHQGPGYYEHGVRVTLDEDDD